MIKLQKFILKEFVHPIDIRIESNLKEVDKLIQYCREMGENSPVMWRGIKVQKNHSLYHIVQDRDWFKGGNLGANTIMKQLHIKNPAFAYIGNMQYVTKIFGRTFAIILKKPYRLFQSDVVDDVMSWAQPIIYQETITGGGLLRQQVGTRTPEEQVEKALEGAKTYKELNSLKNLEGVNNEVIIDTEEYWAVDINELFARAGKFVKQFHKEKKPVGAGRIIRMENYIENYGEILEILTKFKSYAAWKFKNQTEKF